MARKIFFFNLSSSQIALLGILILSTFFSLTLMAFRMYYSAEITFRFLAWNLFLAWIPFGISFLLNQFGEQIKSKFLIGSIVSVWLLFFPNAPYIFTDLFHFGAKPHIPIWFDLVMLLSFAWNGLILGFLSLRDMQFFLGRKLGTAGGWIFSLGALILGSFGIYLGRYLRWNSWDILTHPGALAYDILDRVINPMAHPRTLAITVLFSGLLIMMYLTFQVLILSKPKETSLLDTFSDTH